MKSELSKKHQIEEDLTQELDDCHVLLQSKEADCTRLAKNLGASQVREAEQEAKWMHELQKIKSNLEFKNLRQQQEVSIFKHVVMSFHCLMGMIADVLRRCFTMMFYGDILR